MPKYCVRVEDSNIKNKVIEELKFSHNNRVILDQESNPIIFWVFLENDNTLRELKEWGSVVDFFIAEDRYKQ